MIDESDVYLLLTASKMYWATHRRHSLLSLTSSSASCHVKAVPHGPSLSADNVVTPDTPADMSADKNNVKMTANDDGHVAEARSFMSCTVCPQKNKSTGCLAQF